MVLDDLREQVRIALLRATLDLEGLQDFARLNVKPDTLAALNAAIALYQKRRGILEAMATQLASLANQEDAVIAVSDLVLADLQEQVQSITAALSVFRVSLPHTPGEAVAGGITFSLLKRK